MKALKSFGVVLLCLCWLASLFYFASSLASVKNGLVIEDGITYCYENNVMLTGLQDVNGTTYYFSVKDGHMMKDGWVTAEGGERYYLSSADGHVMKGGQLTADGETYYVDENGAMVTGFVTMSNGKTYYFDPSNGAMIRSASVTVDGVVYTADADGIISQGS